MDVWNAQRDVIHYAEELLVSVGGTVEHKFDPVGTVGYLQVQPVGVFILHTAVPIHVEAQNLFVEVFHRGAIVNDKSSMKEGGQRRMLALVFRSSRSVHEADTMPFRIARIEIFEARCRGSNGDTLRNQILF